MKWAYPVSDQVLMKRKIQKMLRSLSLDVCDKMFGFFALPIEIGQQQAVKGL